MFKDANEILPFATNFHVQIIICVSFSPRPPTGSASNQFVAVSLRQYNSRPLVTYFVRTLLVTLACTPLMWIFLTSSSTPLLYVYNIYHYSL
jgi:hypothetical protein